MKRSVWKLLFGIHLTLLILLIIFDIFLWALANTLGAFQALMFPDILTYRVMDFWEFFAGFYTSPMFYVHLYVITVLVASIVALIATRKNKKQ